MALAGVTSGLIGMAQRVTWRAKHLGVWQTLTSEITAMEPPAYFQDAMVQGAFRSMKHDHFFRAFSSSQTEMKDVFCFAAPLPVLGRLAEIVLLRRYMRALLHERNVVVKQIAESSDWQQYLPSTLEATESPLCESSYRAVADRWVRSLPATFTQQGHEVTVFSRSPQPAPWRVVAWDGLTPGDWIGDLEESDVCINLAGRSVNCRYTAANRRAI